MRQMFGKKLAMVVVGALPADGFVGGTDLTSFEAAMKCAKYAIEVTVTVAPANVSLAVCEENGDNAIANRWYLVGDTGNLGKLGGQQLPVGQYIFTVENIGIFKQIVLIKDAGTVTAQLVEYIENNFRRAD